MPPKSLNTEKLLNNGKFLDASDASRYYALSYDKNKQVAWLETVRLTQNKTLNDIDVSTLRQSKMQILLNIKINNNTTKF